MPGRQRSRMLATCCSVAGFLFLLFTAPRIGAGQERPWREREAEYRKLAEGGFRVSAQYSHYYLDEATHQWVAGLAGKVEAYSKDIRVRASNVVVWFNYDKYEAFLHSSMQTGKAAGDEAVQTLPWDAVEEIYADEDVTIETEKESARAERFYLDRKTGKAIFINGYVQTYQAVRGRIVPLHLRAQEIRQLAEGYFVATDASITNCNFGEPHWHLKASQVTLDTRSPGESLFRADNASFRVGDLPIFWLPYIQGDLSGGSSTYFKGGRAGHSSRFGTFAETKWGSEIRFGSGADRYTWGDWTLHLDPSTERGLGYGLDVDYETASNFGRFRSYYIHDTGDTDKNDQPIEERNRGRVRLQHRQEDLPFGFEGTAEISYLTDKNFLTEYFDNEAKTGKEQETVAYLKKVWDDQAFTILGKWRINDFQTTTEYLPQVGYQMLYKPLLPGTPLGTNLYFTDETQVANARFSPGEDLTGEARRQTTRFDSRNQINVPISIGDLNLNPFVEGRYTAYGEPNDPQSQSQIARVTAASGFRLDTQVWRVYDASIRPIGVHGVRHVLNPEIAYLNRWAVTQAPEELIQFDDVDTIRKQEFFEFSVRNRLETHGGKQVRTFLDWRTSNRFFPEPTRDNDGEPWGTLDNDVRALLSERLLVFWDSQYDWYRHGFAVMNTGVRVVPSEDVRFFLGHRFVRDEASVVTGGLEVRLSEKWAFDVLEQVDTKDGREIEDRIVLQRYVHDWVFEFTFSVDHNTKDTRVSVAIYPRDFYFGSRRKRGFDNSPFFDRGAETSTRRGD